MQTYTIYPNSHGVTSTGREVRAQNIDNLRARIIKEYILKADFVEVMRGNSFMGTVELPFSKDGRAIWTKGNKASYIALDGTLVGRH